MDTSDFADEEENGAKDWASFFKPSFVLIALDVHPSMFTGDPQPHFRMCLNACVAIAESLILTQNRRSWSQFGVVLTREDAAATLINFETNLIDVIKNLKAELKRTDDELRDLYQRKTKDFDLGTFFLLCKKKFKDVTQVSYKRTIVLLTNHDDPVDGDGGKRFRALNEAKNFEAADISFNLLTMIKNFDYTNFYNELYSIMGADLVEEFIQDQDGLVDKLSSLIVNRHSSQKMIFYPFRDDRSRFLRINEKKLIQKQKLYDNAHVTSAGKKVKKLFKSESMDVPSFYLQYSSNESRRLNFDVQEHFDIKHNDFPIGYHLIQVSKRLTRVGYTMGAPTLIECGPKEIAELPVDYFASFWQFCVDQDKVLICIKKSRDQEKIRFVELIPKFGNGSRLFLVKKLPFADEILPPPSKLAEKVENPVDTPDRNKEELIKKLVTTLDKDYYPEMFVDPMFARKKAYIKSKLLGEPLEEVQDPTISTSGIDRHISAFDKSFIASFNLLMEKRGKKKAAPRAAPTKSKKAKLN